MSIRATYRLQFHKDFTFPDAEKLAPYLEALGISHLYASPITTAQPGSTHGYDVVDPTRINPELGGEDGFRSLVAALRARGMGAIIDIVPNHMGVAGGDNHWWLDVLEKGPASDHARVFDIDWREKLLLPFLGDPLPRALEGLRLRDEDRLAVVAYDTHVFPIRQEDHAEVRAAGLAAYDPAAPEGRARLSELLDRQHYRLAWWRAANDELNWRRFFTITELAGVRAEDDAVFEASHALYFRLYAEGLIDGVRVDHVDGLTDPAGYCRKLRARLQSLEAERPQGLPREPAYLVVEKILAADEPLSRDWGVDGTSGYDFMAEVAALMHAPGGEAPLGRFWQALSGRPADFAAEELQARRDMLSWEFEGQLSSTVRAFAALARSAEETQGLTEGMLRRAAERLLWVFPVYRTYGTGGDAPESDARIREIAAARALPLAAPGEQDAIRQLLRWLAGEGPGDAALAGDAVRRFQQLSAPIAAKAVEDTAFYRYGRLLSCCDVGFDPGSFSLNLQDFHCRMEERRAAFPHAMLATATHDHKRGEDMRARLAVLSEVPGEWTARVEAWTGLNRALTEGVAPDDLYQLYQTLFGAWPADLAAGDAAALSAFGKRVVAWQEKALREAKLRSSWAAPDGDYEARARAAVDALLDPSRSGAFLGDLAAFVRRLRPAAEANALVQSFLRCTAPGVPDLYQGAEFEDLSLVDPDNRRPVDFEARQRSLGAPAQSFDSRKQAMIAAILDLRKQRPTLWAEGRYEPVEVEGPRAAHVLAFRRHAEGATMLAVAALHCAPAMIEAGECTPPAGWWGDTRLRLPEAEPLARGILDDQAGGSLVSDLLARMPVYLGVIDAARR